MQQGSPQCNQEVEVIQSCLVNQFFCFLHFRDLSSRCLSSFSHTYAYILILCAWICRRHTFRLLFQEDAHVWSHTKPVRVVVAANFHCQLSRTLFQNIVKRRVSERSDTATRAAHRRDTRSQSAPDLCQQRALMVKELPWPWRMQFLPSNSTALQKRTLLCK